MARFSFDGISARGVYGNAWKKFFHDLKDELKDDNITNGSAALAYYLMLAIFPALIFLLSLLPYLPIPNLNEAVMDLMNQLLPGQTASLFTGTVREVVSQRKGGLLSGGVLLTLWAASSGMYAIMQQLNITYDVKEGRSFLKARGTALGLTIVFGLLLIAAFALVVLGGYLQNWLAGSLGFSAPLLIAFAAARWVIIVFALTLAFGITYYFAPDVEQEFKFITPGSVLCVLGLIAASLAFRAYVENFGSYNKTYGGLGAVIVLMLWLNITGIMLLIGSEINALIEHYGKQPEAKGLTQDKDRRMKMVDIERFRPGPREEEEAPQSYATVLREIGNSLIELFQSEAELISAEVKDTASRLGRHSAQTAVFGALLSLSVFPFLAFLVIGLGRLLGDQYWLSSLIIAVVCGVVGGVLTQRAYAKIKEQDLTLSRSRESLERGREVVSEKMEEVREATRRRAA